MVPLEAWLAKYGESTNKAHYIQPDLEPYMAVSGDMAGKMIRSRREHREFLKRNRFEEVGNEKAYMTRNNGMSDDNPNAIPEHRREETLCRSLSETLNRLRNR